MSLGPHLKDWTTPIGTFDLDLKGSYDFEYTLINLTKDDSIKDKRLLIVRVDSEMTVFELTEGEEFKVEFQSGESGYKKVGLIYQDDGDIILELESVGKHVVVSQPDTPTPTRRPPATSTPRPRPTSTPTIRPTPRPQITTCQFQVTGRFANLWKQYQEKLGCPKYQEAYTLQVGEQLFENGHMFYLSDRSPWILIVYGDGTWQALQSKWRPGIDPEYSCNISPPGRVLPYRGFGEVWCNQVNQSKIGWALDREYGFDPGLTYVQDFEDGIIYLDSDGANSSGLAYVLFSNGTFTQARY